MNITRREMIQIGAGASAGLMLGCTVAEEIDQGLITKEIPSTGESIPVIGLGGRNYRLGEGWADNTDGYKATLGTFYELGGRVIDTSPNYGDSEIIMGNLLQELGVRDGLFLATKVDRQERDEGIERMQGSLQRMHTDSFELMQVHNLRGWETQIPTLREWKEEGKIKYIGITTSSDRQYEQMEQIMLQETLDFIQIDYAIDNRTAEEKLLPLARDMGVGVLINMPFGRGRLFARVGDRELPEWSAEFGCKSWGQFFLKYVVSHPAVTAVIPGTTSERNAVDNIAAGKGLLPTSQIRSRMEEFIDALPPVERSSRS